MKCYYEQLGVPRDVSDAEIKTAYRKLALKWHPDKNPERLEEAKERFQVIQQAYEVLSDSHERAWYDNHREQILRGKNSDYEENCLDVFQYFTTSCYKGYEDNENGFYNVYGEVFKKIAAEDAEFLDDEEDILKVPHFGKSTSIYEDVVGPFYAYWQSYCTKKTYTWLCPYDIQEIKDRRILREIEKDLKKVVQKAKRERNEEVRNLVSFIRKRDKRVQAYKKLLEDRAVVNRQKQEQNRIERIRKRNLEVREMQNGDSFNEGYEEQLKQLEQEYADDNYSNGASDEEQKKLNEDSNSNILDEDLYCVACNRLFKNRKGFGNHEASKKHRENIEFLKEEMLKSQKQILEKELKVMPSDENLGQLRVTDIELNPDVDKSNKKPKKLKKSKTANIQIETEISCDEIELVDVKSAQSEEWTESGKKNSKKNKNKKNRKQNEAFNEAKPISGELAKESTTLSSVSNSLNLEAISHTCATCYFSFDSKNKLFAHLKKTNHGVYVPKEKPDLVEEKNTFKLKSKGKRK